MVLQTFGLKKKLYSWSKTFFTAISKLEAKGMINSLFLNVYLT